MLKQNYDQHAKEHKSLQPGATVRYRKHNAWSKKGRVVKKLSQPRSYQIETESGNIIRRNRRHLIHTREPFVPRPRHEIHIFHNQFLPRCLRQHNPMNNATNLSLVQLHQPKMINQLKLKLQNYRILCLLQQADIQPYRTRSGRTVRPPTRFKDYSEH